MAARLPRIKEHSLFFMSCSLAIAPIKPLFVATELFFAAFIAFIAVIAFMGAMVVRDCSRIGEEETSKNTSKLE